MKLPDPGRLPDGHGGLQPKHSRGRGRSTPARAPSQEVETRWTELAEMLPGFSASGVAAARAAADLQQLQRGWRPRGRPQINPRSKPSDIRPASLPRIFSPAPRRHRRGRKQTRTIAEGSASSMVTSRPTSRACSPPARGFSPRSRPHQGFEAHLQPEENDQCLREIDTRHVNAAARGKALARSANAAGFANRMRHRRRTRSRPRRPWGAGRAGRGAEIGRWSKGDVIRAAAPGPDSDLVHRSGGVRSRPDRAVHQRRRGRRSSAAELPGTAGVFQMARTVRFAPNGQPSDAAGDSAPLSAGLDTEPKLDARQVVGQPSTWRRPAERSARTVSAGS